MKIYTDPVQIPKKLIEQIIDDVLMSADIEVYLTTLLLLYTKEVDFARIIESKIINDTNLLLNCKVEINITDYSLLIEK